MEKKSWRLRILVDPKVQGALVCRVVFYWCLCVALMGVLAAVQVAYSSKSADWSLLFNRALMASGPALIASFFLLPLVLVDALRFSLRFAGPMHRLRREVKNLADGDVASPLHFRKGDYWYDLAVQFNRLAEQLREARQSSTEMRRPSEEETETAAPPEEAGVA